MLTFLNILLNIFLIIYLIDNININIYIHFIKYKKIFFIKNQK